MKNQTILKLMTAGLLILAATVFLTGCSGSADEASSAGDLAEHVDDAADGDATATEAPDAHDDGDADAHDDGDMDMDMDMDDTSYLEAAPKDALFLIDMAQLAFTPSVLEVKAGEVIEIAIQNSEAALHDFTIDTVDADVHISYLGGTGQHEHEESAKEADVHFALTEPGSGIVHLKIHEPGEYVFYCSVPGHQGAGMEGTLIVTEA